MESVANPAGENPCPEKQNYPLDSDRPSHGRRLHSLTLMSPFINMDSKAADGGSQPPMCRNVLRVRPSGLNLRPAMPARDFPRSDFHFVNGNFENSSKFLGVVANFFSDSCQ